MYTKNSALGTRSLEGKGGTARSLSPYERFISQVIYKIANVPWARNDPGPEIIPKLDPKLSPTGPEMILR